MKVALIHYWLVNMRGGEKVLKALADLYPGADIYTHVASPELVAKEFPGHRVIETGIARLPRAQKMYQSYLPFMPIALEQLDLSGYDLVISSESGPAKGVIVGPDTHHICYCHTPMRYVWDMYPQYLAETSRFKRLLMPWLIHKLRLWDYSTAQRVDKFIANSHFVRSRIMKYYRRDAAVINPPVDIGQFYISTQPEDYYLMLGQLVGYKRADVAVKAFTESGRKLVVVGEGAELPRLKRMAGPNIQFLGRQPSDAIAGLYSKCRALIFPGVEDFGIVPLEAMASGRPVIAFGKGGALETVVHGKTGLLYQDASPAGLQNAVAEFESMSGIFQPDEIRAHALRFSTEVFKKNISAFIESEMKPDVSSQSTAAAA